MIIPRGEISGCAKGYHVIIERPFGGTSIEIFLLKEAHPQWMNASSTVTNIQWTPFNEGDRVEPFLRLPFRDSHLLEALAEAFRGSGIVTTDENTLKGKLEAKDDHLQDLRHLLKLPKKTP